jgi:uncharacterized protein with HEPN domain
MKDDLLAYLDDILRSGRAIKAFVAGCTFEDYSSDELLRSGVERKLEIIGESLNRIKRDEPEFLQQIPKHRDIISFRNILVHGYDTIDDRIVWGIIEEGLGALLDAVDTLLQQKTIEQEQ